MSLKKEAKIFGNLPVVRQRNQNKQPHSQCIRIDVPRMDIYLLRLVVLFSNRSNFGRKANRLFSLILEFFVIQTHIR